LDSIAWRAELDHYYWWCNHCHSLAEMTKKQALTTLKRIARDPGLADQFTEEEIEKLEKLAAKK